MIYQEAIRSNDLGQIANLFASRICDPRPLDTPESVEDRQIALTFYLAHVFETMRRSHEEK